MRKNSDVVAATRVALVVASAFAVTMFAGAAHPSRLSAQDTAQAVIVDTSRAASGWDTPRVREMMLRAAMRRTQPRADTALHNYRATAEGFLYFFLDRRDTDERTLVRVHQIGLELFWKQPDVARQRIAGLRDVSPLPNIQRYHIDHLTMVQNGFGDVIRVGDGDEVGDVVHPASVGADRVYQFRLGDSLDLRLAGMPQSIRVYEIQVRPRRADQPGFVGSIFIDRSTADIIRMTFTFTASSYVDKRLDYINLSLDNALWEGKYWLPNEQTVEIRRQIPQLDFVAGTVIRGRMRINDYELNANIPDSIFGTNRAVVSASADELLKYPFRQGIYDDVTNAGLSQNPETTHLREEAAQLVGSKLLSGLPPVRLYYPDISSGIRYNRAEGVFLGLGLSYSEGPPWRFDGSAGYAFGAHRPSLLARTTYAPGPTTLALAGYTRALRDLGPVTALNGIANTLSSAILGRDYLDPWFASGVSLSMTKPVTSAMQFRVTAAAERQRSASLVTSTALLNHSERFRGIRPTDEGDEYSITPALSRGLPTRGNVAWGGSLALHAARFESTTNATYVKPELHLDLALRTDSHARELRATAAASTTSSNAPAQQFFTIGGVGTLPGYTFRSFAGRSGAFASAEITQRLIYPWIGVRALTAIGATSSLPQTPTTGTWSAHGSNGLRASAGIGASLFYDIAHIDLVKGLNGGSWVAQLSFTRILDDIS